MGLDSQRGRQSESDCLFLQGKIVSPHHQDWVLAQSDDTSNARVSQVLCFFF